MDLQIFIDISQVLIAGIVAILEQLGSDGHEGTDIGIVVI